MSPKQPSLRNISELCLVIQKDDPSAFQALKELMFEWRQSEETKQIYKRLILALKGKRKIMQLINSFLEESIQIKALKISQEFNCQTVTFLKSKKLNDRLQKYQSFLRDISQSSQQISHDLLAERIIRHFQDLPQLQRALRGDAQVQKLAYVQPITLVAQLQTAQQTQLQQISEQWLLIKKLKQGLSAQKFNQLVKIIFLYQQCIISKFQIFRLLQKTEVSKPAHWALFENLIITTQVSRRKASAFFKPLIDIDCSKRVRATHSYVLMPEMYPIRCKGKELNPSLKKVLNDSWVSVPLGSEHSAFHIMHKNQFQQALLKSEDEKYQLDMFIQRSKRGLTLIQNVLGTSCLDRRHRSLSLQGVQNYNCVSAQKQLFQLGVIQTIYKNASRDEKFQFQTLWEERKHDCMRVVHSRLKEKVQQLLQIKKINKRHFEQISQKNYQRSLDRKSFQFKKNQKNFMKDSFFLKDIEARFRPRTNKNYFNEKNRSNLQLFNSFQNLSVIERCTHEYDKSLLQILKSAQDQIKTEKLPLYIFAFDNKQICSLTLSILLNIAEQMFASNHNQKNKIKVFLNFILANFLGIVNESTQKLRTETRHRQELDRRHEDFFFLAEESQQLQFFPQSKGFKQFFCSLKIFFFLRLFYSLVERLTKARSLLEDQAFNHFISAVETSLKNKDNVNRWEDAIRQIFGKNSFMFITINKLFEQNLKQAQQCILDPFSNSTIDIYNQQIPRQDIYYLTVNKKQSQYQCSKFIVRLLLKDSLLLINMAEGMYLNWQIQSKERQRDKQNQLKIVSKRLQQYLRQVDKCNEPLGLQKCQVQFNGLQYLTCPNSTHLIYHGSLEDRLIRVYRRHPRHDIELKRAFKFSEKLKSL